MTRPRTLTCFSVLVVAACSAGQDNSAAHASPQTALWVGIGVAHPVFQLRDAENMTVSFVVVNDGRTAANPRIGSSRLFINGVEPADWAIVINNGLRSEYFESLPPGRILSFGYLLGPRYFSRPGIYSVRWQVQNATSEVTFRVMPAGN